MSPHNARRRARIVRRAGFTMVELLVAMMIFSVGVLGMVASAGAMMNMIGSSQSRNIAASIAESRFERLRAMSCGAQLDGSTTTRGLKETWVVDHLVGVNDVTVTVSFWNRRTKINTSFRSYIPC
jgi:type IV pilus modification protein PilV